MTDKTPKQLALEATAAAKAALIAGHEDEFRALKRKEYEARGLEFPQTPQEKALDELRKLLERQPDVLVLGVASGLLGPQHGVLPPRTQTVEEHLGAEPADDITDDIDLPPDHGITPPNQNPEDPWSAPAPGTPYDGTQSQ